MAGFCCGGAFDGGEQGGAGLAGQAAELGREGRIEGGPAAPGGGDGFFDAAAVLAAEPGERLLVGEDEPAQGLDLFPGTARRRPGPARRAGGGGEAFGIGEQLAEIAAQLRLVGGSVRKYSQPRQQCRNG